MLNSTAEINVFSVLYKMLVRLKIRVLVALIDRCAGTDAIAACS